MLERHFKLNCQDYSADIVIGGEHALCEPAEFIIKLPFKRVLATKGKPPVQYLDPED
jgi:hypothetical protein